MKESATVFKLLFSGSKEAYGVHVPAVETTEGEKAKGASYTKREPLTDAHYDAHLAGALSLGVVPISGDKLSFFALDIDEYPSNPAYYCRLLAKNNLPLSVFRSKSGGLHLYGFFVQPSNAADVLALVPNLKTVLGLPNATETFPKQSKVSEGAIGNWINLPYYNAQDTKRYMYDEDGKPLSFTEAMEQALTRRTSVQELASVLRKVPLSLAPPCLQTMYLQDRVGPSNRNIFLFNVASYLKQRFRSGFVEKLSTLNETLSLPLTHQELMTTVVASHEKGEYSYQCQESALLEYCNKEECAKRKYGKAQSAVKDFTFERLVQVRSSTPYYKWTVNGVEMTFYSEAELRDQNKFSDYCMRYLHKLPPPMKNAVWYEILNSALAAMEIEEIKREEDISSPAIWFAYFKEFIEARMHAEAPSQVNAGLVYYDEEDKGYYFRIEDLLQYMEVVRHYRETKITEIHYKLRKLGIITRKLKDVSNSRKLSAWFCPEHVLELDTTAADVIKTEAPALLEADIPLHKEKKQAKNKRIMDLLSKIKDDEEDPF